MSWPNDFIMSEIPRTPEINANPNANPSVVVVAATEKNNTIFQINNASYQFPVVNLSINDKTRFLENIKQ